MRLDAANFRVRQLSEQLAAHQQQVRKLAAAEAKEAEQVGAQPSP